VTVLQPWSDATLTEFSVPDGFPSWQVYEANLYPSCILFGINYTNWETLVEESYTQFSPPQVITHAWLMDIDSRDTYWNNLEAQCEAAQTSSTPAFTMGGGFMPMDDGGGGDPCVITNYSIPFGIVSIAPDGSGHMVLQWESCTNAVYIVQSTSALPSTSWTDIAWMFGTDQETSWTDTNAVGLTQDFYQVVRGNPATLNNGIPYGWAVTYGLDPLDPNLAFEYPAGDGIDTLQKYQCGLNPLVPYIISTPPGVGRGTTNTASIPAAGAGVTYTWSVTNNGTLVSGQSTTNIIWTAGNLGTATVSVTLSNSPSCNTTISATVAVVNHAYYIDYVGGNDSITNLGTSATSPWKHCPGDPAALVASAPYNTTLKPGDTVFFKGGVNYILTATNSTYDAVCGGIVLSANSSGTNAPIIYNGNIAGTWGTGPAIITDYGATNFHAGFYRSGGDLSNVTVQGFLFTGIGGIGTNALPSPTNSEVAFSGGEGFHFDGGGKLVNCSILSCTFTNLGYWQPVQPFGVCSIAANGCAESGGNTPAGIQIFGGAVNVTISNNVINHTFAGLDLGYENTVSNLTICNNDFGDDEVWGIHIGAAGGTMDYTYIHNNNIHDIGGAYSPDYYTGYDAGAMHQDPFFLVVSYPTAPNCGSNIDVYANNFYCGAYTGGTVSAVCFIEGGMSANFYNNLFDEPQIYATAGQIGLLVDNPASTQFGVRVLNNTFVINTTNLSWSFALYVEADVTNYDGSIYQANYVWPTNNSPLLVENNIAYSFTTTSGQQATLLLLSLTNSFPISTWTFNNNDWYSAQYYNIFWLNNQGNGGTNFSGSLATMQSVLGLDATGITNSPNFLNISHGAGTNSSQNNYSITNGPTIGAGTNLSALGLLALNYNLNGQTNGRPATGPWNQGAY
jgi:hypothetical protein